MDAKSAVERVGKAHEEILSRPHEDGERNDARNASTEDIRLEIRCYELMQRGAVAVEEREQAMLGSGIDERRRAEDQDDQRKQCKNGVERDRLRQKRATVARKP